MMTFDRNRTDDADLKRQAAELQRHIAGGTAPRRSVLRADELPPGPTAREAASLESAALLFNAEVSALEALPGVPDLSDLTPFDKAALRAEVRRGLFSTLENGQKADVIDLAETRRGRLPALASD